MNDRIFYRKLFTAPNFFNDFADALDSVFPNGWVQFFEDGDYINDAPGTIGWRKALGIVCEKLGLEDCLKYYDDHDWMACDELDAYIMTILLAVVFDESGRRIKCNKVIYK